MYTSALDRTVLIFAEVDAMQIVHNFRDGGGWEQGTNQRDQWVPGRDASMPRARPDQLAIDWKRRTFPDIAPRPLPPRMSLLSDSEGEQDDLNLLTINEHYAKAFEYKKERQELEKRAFWTSQGVVPPLIGDAQ